ncbi:MAG: hypothetical protein QOH50_1249 [Kribbellaceae bacterium]|jgi:hypothetical protein|nr:hypothetical protein [Kribbellaceae bacterium]
MRPSQPDPVLSQDEVGILVNSAMAAPSMHNNQPWRFEIFGPVVDVILGRDRPLPAEDPAGRFIRIGIGAATFNLRVAAAMLGYETTFAIDPDPARPDIIARVFLGELQTPIPPLSNLYGELRRRHTCREPVMMAEVSPRVLDQVSEAARAEGADLHWLGADQRVKLSRILHEADWIGGDHTAAGIPEIAILTTTADGPSDWVRAGMGLQRALLTATPSDLAVSLLNQAVEYARLRLPAQELVGHNVWPQLIIRVGYPADEGGGAPCRHWQQAVTHWH